MVTSKVFNAEFLRNYRETNSLSQADLAKQLNVVPTTIHNLENGITTKPNSITLKKVASGLKVRTSLLWVNNPNGAVKSNLVSLPTKRTDSQKYKDAQNAADTARKENKRLFDDEKSVPDTGSESDSLPVTQGLEIDSMTLLPEPLNHFSIVGKFDDQSLLLKSSTHGGFYRVTVEKL